MLHGKQIQVFTGSGFQICTVESGYREPFPFRARSQDNKCQVYFNLKTTERLQSGKKVPGIKLL